MKCAVAIYNRKHFPAKAQFFMSSIEEKQSSNILCQVINYGFVLKIHRSIVSDLGSKQCCDREDSRDCVEHLISINFGSRSSKNLEHSLQTQVAFLSFILEKREPPIWTLWHDNLCPCYSCYFAMHNHKCLKYVWLVLRNNERGWGFESRVRIQPNV